MGANRLEDPAAIAAIRTRSDFARYLSLYVRSVQQSPAGWCEHELTPLLERMAGLIFEAGPTGNPDWPLLANILAAARHAVS